MKMEEMFHLSQQSWEMISRDFKHVKDHHMKLISRIDGMCISDGVLIDWMHPRVVSKDEKHFCYQIYTYHDLKLLDVVMVINNTSDGLWSSEVLPIEEYICNHQPKEHRNGKSILSEGSQTD